MAMYAQTQSKLNFYWLLFKMIIKRGRKPKTDASRAVRRQTLALYNDQCVALKAIAGGGSYAYLIRAAIDSYLSLRAKEQK